MRWRIKPLTSSLDDPWRFYKAQPQASSLALLLLLFKTLTFSSQVSIFGCVGKMGRKIKEMVFITCFLTSFQVHMFGFGILNGRKVRRNGSYNGISPTSKPRVKNPILTKCSPHPYLIISIIQSIENNSRELNIGSE